MSATLRCALCGVTGTNLSRCSGCRSTAYCSREHQVSHWKSAHKLECARLAAAASGTGPASSAGRTAPAAAAPPTDEEVAAAVGAFDRFAEALRRQTREEAADADERGIGGNGDQAVFITRSVEGKGRAAFAIRDIAQGEEPFEEAPYAFAPNCRTLRRRDVCHHCFKAMKPGPETTSARCRKCNTIAFCSSCRAEGEVMHRTECFYVKKLSHLILNMEVLMLLRILIMRWLETLSAAKKGSTGTPIYDRMMAMQAHTSAQIDLLQAYAPAVEEIYRVLPADLRVTKESMLKIVCICSVNQFGVGEPASDDQRTESASDGEGSGLFLNAAIISHSCRENAMHRATGHKLRMLALEPIAIGQEITWSYLGNPLLPTQIRQRELYHTKMFVCRCSRCTDLTESHLRAFPCKKCGDGLLIPLPLTNDTIEAEEDQWRCNNVSCNQLVGFASTVEALERGLVTKFEEAHAALATNQDISAALQRLETIVTEHSDVLMHSHHYLLLQIYQLHGQLLRKKLDARLPPLPTSSSASGETSGSGQSVPMNEDQRTAIRKQIEVGLRLMEPLEQVVEDLLPSRHPLKADHYEGKANVLERLLQVTTDPARSAEIASLLSTAKQLAK